MEMKLEVVPVPVSNVDASIDFYVNKVGFSLDHDHKVKPGLRFVQLTPQGSACSIIIGTGITEMKPGSQKNLQMVIKDAVLAHDKLQEKGIEMTEVTELPWGIFTGFSDPDGNTWSLQQISQAQLTS